MNSIFMAILFRLNVFLTILGEWKYGLDICSGGAVSVPVCAISCSVMSDILCPRGLYSPPGSSIRGIAQERILEWIAISSSRRSSQSRDRTHVSCIGRQILYHCATLEDCGERDRVLNLHLPLEKWMCAKLLQSCPILYGPMDCSPPGSSVHGVF